MDNINIFIGIIVVVLALSLLHIKKQSRLILSISEQIPKTIKFVKEKEIILPETTRTVKHKNYITINGNTNVVQYVFNKTLKHVTNIELISAIIPRSNYRVNENNMYLYITVGANPEVQIPITNGVYQNISELLLEINVQILNGLTLGASVYLNIILDNLSKNIVFLTNSTDTISFNFSSNLKTCARILGVENMSNVILNSTTPTGTNDFLDTSIYYLTSLYSSGLPVNNLPAAYYSGLTDLFAPNTSDFSDGSWSFASGNERVNISQQLYMDIELDNITYWDGNNILQKLYIDEAQSLTQYNRQYPAYRHFNEQSKKLDRITLRFFSIINETTKIPYEFNGLDYSLQLEIITKNKELIVE